jgi:hypothetical protein
MPPYQVPEPNTEYYSKFIRLEGDIFVGRPYLQDGHMKIAEMDHLQARIDELKAANPDQIDAGYLKVEPDTIAVFQDSEMLKLPVSGHEEQARAITLQTFEQQTPGRRIKESLL